MKILWAFIKERLGVYFFYLCFVGITLFTFYLHDLALRSFYDSLLFSVFLLVLFSVISFYRYFRKIKQLEWMSKQEISGNAIAFLPKATSRTEHLYQQMLLQEIQQKNQKEEVFAEKKKEIMDDFGLWLHQIKTPVAALDLLIQHGQADTVQLQAELFKINEYLQMMLNYLRQNLDTEDLVFEQQKLDAVVKAVVKKYAVFFSQKDLQLKLGNLDERVVTDKKWLIFILEQVIFNAVKYTKNGKITIEASENELTITDTGIGIRQEDLPRIFDKGYTGYNGREQQRASGLGLYLSKIVAEKIGCQLAITSQINYGTKVTILFPEKHHFCK